MKGKRGPVRAICPECHALIKLQRLNGSNGKVFVGSHCGMKITVRIVKEGY
jgi:hypothetical protein